jgi:hypothetical protein
LALGKVLSASELNKLEQVVNKFSGDDGVRAAVRDVLGGFQDPRDPERRVQKSSLPKYQNILQLLTASPGVTGTNNTGGAAAVERSVPTAIDGLPHVKNINTVLTPKAARKFAVRVLGFTEEQAKKYIKSASDLGRGVVVVDMARMMPDGPLKQVLAGEVVLRPNTQTYKLDNQSWGQQVIVDGGKYEKVWEALNAMDGLGVKTMTQRKNGTYIAGPDPATFGEAVKGERGTFGKSHGGFAFATQNETGEKVVVLIDWPRGYGRNLSGEGGFETEYTGSISRISADDFKFDGAGMTKEQKDQFHASVKSRAAMFLATVDFSSQDSRAGLNDYHWSPYEDETAKQVGSRLDLIPGCMKGDAAALAEMKRRTFYCEEGVNATPNSVAMVPMNQWSVDKGLIKKETLEYHQKCNTVFQAATAGGKPAAVGWRALVTEGLMTSDRLENMKQADAAGRQCGADQLPFVLDSDDARPLTELGVKGLDGDGLLSKPQHVGGLLRATIGLSFSRDALVRELSEHIGKKLGELPTAGRDGLLAQIGAAQGLPGPVPLKAFIEGTAYKTAVQMQAGLLASPEMQETIKGAMGYRYMDQASKGRVDGMITEYMGVVSDDKLTPETFNAKLLELDKNAEQLEVRYEAVDWKGLIRHTPPHARQAVFAGILGYTAAGNRPAFEILAASRLDDN